MSAAAAAHPALGEGTGRGSGSGCQPVLGGRRARGSTQRCEGVFVAEEPLSAAIGPPAALAQPFTCNCRYYCSQLPFIYQFFYGINFFNCKKRHKCQTHAHTHTHILPPPAGAAALPSRPRARPAPPRASLYARRGGGGARRRDVQWRPVTRKGSGSGGGCRGNQRRGGLRGAAAMGELGPDDGAGNTYSLRPGLQRR